MKKIILSTIISSLLIGCSTTRIPTENPDRYGYEQIEARILDEWEVREMPITYIDADISFGIERRNQVSQEIKDIQIKNLTIPNGETLETLKDLLKMYDINLFIPSSDISSMNFSVRNFSGSLGDLFNIIENGY